MRYAFKTEPYAHQRKALGKIHRLGGSSGLWMPMRTGKTKVAIDWASIAFHNFGLRRVLVVCPITPLEEVWVPEIAKHSPVPSVVTVLRDTAVKNAITSKRMTEATDVGRGDNAIDWVLVNYEMVWRKIEETGPRGGKHKVTLDEIIARWKPDLVVADEAHKLKQYTSRQSLALARLGKAARMRLGLTGTPITKWPLDAYGLFRFIDPTVFEQDKWRCWRKDPDTGRIHEHEPSCEGFADHFATWEPTRHTPNLYEVSGYKNLDELVGKIRKHSYAITLKDAFPDLPEQMPPTDIRVKLSPSARRIYDDMAKEMIAEITDAAGNVRVATADIILTKLVRLSQITSGFVKDEAGVEVDIDDGKLRTGLELIDNMIEQDEKVVVFCRFVHDYHRLQEALARKSISYASLTGETPQRERTANIARFRTPSVPVFVTQLQSGSVGIDLSAARMSLFYSLGYNWADYVQATQRTLDPRKHRPLGIYRLLVPNSVDMVQKRVLDERGQLAEAIIHRPQSLLDGA